MILPHVTDFQKVLSGEINQACFHATLRPESMMPGHWYEFEMLTADPVPCEDGTWENENTRVLRMACQGMGWVHSDYCVDDPQESFSIRWAEGREYSVQHRNKTVWYAPAYDYYDRFTGYYIAHEIRLNGEGPTDWERAHTSLFTCDNKPHPKSWLDNEGYKPLRIRITGIDQVDVRKLTEADAQAMGYKNLLCFWGVWADKHDPAIFLKDNPNGSWNLTHYPNKGNGHVDRRFYNYQVANLTYEDIFPRVKFEMALRLSKRYEAWQLKFTPVLEKIA